MSSSVLPKKGMQMHVVASPVLSKEVGFSFVPC